MCQSTDVITYRHIYSGSTCSHVFQMVRYRSSLESTFQKYFAVRKYVGVKNKIPHYFRASGLGSLVVSDYGATRGPRTAACRSRWKAIYGHLGQGVWNCFTRPCSQAVVTQGIFLPDRRQSGCIASRLHGGFQAGSDLYPDLRGHSQDSQVMTGWPVLSSPLQTRSDT